MRRSLALALLLGTAACGQQDNYDPELDGGVANDVSTDVDATAEMSAPPSSRAERAAAGPEISPTAAPGVAFNYRYAFRLPAERISEVQEQHASFCEQLGPNRCRITGMLYRVRNERDIEARLTFRVDPTIARRFGREGVQAVLRAEGMLVESEISGTDVAPRIQQAGRSIAQMRQDLQRIEARLAGRLSSGDRENLLYEAQRLRESIRAAEANRREAQDSLATTPMTYVYGSGDLVPGSDQRRPLRDSLERAWNGFVDGLAILLIVAVTLLPWVFLAGLVWLLVRLIRRRLFPGRPTAAESEPMA